MTVTITQTPADNIPEDFTLESLSAHLTQAEIDAVQAGEEPLIKPAGPTPEEVAAKAAADQAAAEAAAAAAVEAAKAPAPANIPDTSQAEAVIAQIDTKLEALKAQFDDGDLTYAEWMAQQNTLIKQQAQAQVQIERAQDAISQNVAQRRADFYAALDAYKSAGNEFLWDQNTHLAGWDEALRTVTGNSQYAALPAQRQIELAHDLYAANVKAVTGKAIKGTAAAAAGEANAADPGPRTDPRPDPIQTLGGFNGDTNAAIDDGTYAAILRISETDPLEAERRLSALGPDRQEQFLRRIV